MIPLLNFLSLFVGTALAMAPMQSTPPLSLSEWEAEKGDIFVVNTAKNMGYLIHPDGRFLADVVGSGKRGVVSYGGNVYDASTPSDLWRIKSTTIQNDRGTFGPTGMFLRLYGKNGVKYTKYGIHDVANNADLLAAEDRYWSMGCVLVRADLLALLEEEYALHQDGEGFLVVTLDDFDVQKPMSTLASAK